jgi:hypothetical protein
VKLGSLSSCDIRFKLKPVGNEYLYIGNKRGVFDSGSQGYLFKASGSGGDVGLYRNNAGSLTLLFEYNTITSQYYNFRILNDAGTFRIFINDIQVAADSGSNPVTDTTYNEMRFLVLDLDAGAKLVYASRIVRTHFHYRRIENE